MKKLSYHITIFCASFLLSLCARSGLAGAETSSNTTGASELRDKENLSGEIDLYSMYIPYCSTDAMPGKVGIVKAGGNYCRDLTVLDVLPVSIELDMDYINIDKTVPVPLPVSLIDVGVALDTYIPFFSVKDTYVSAGITPSFACSADSFGEASFYMPARLLLVYTPSDKLIVAAGVEFFTNFDNDIQPKLGIIYKPDDRWTVDLASDDPSVTYRVNERADLFAEGTYAVFDQYKVRKGGDRGVLLEYKDITAGAGFNIRPVNSMLFSLSAGGVFDRSLKYPEAGGKVDIEKGYYFQGKGQITF